MEQPELLAELKLGDHIKITRPNGRWEKRIVESIIQYGNDEYLLEFAGEIGLRTLTFRKGAWGYNDGGLWQTVVQIEIISRE